MVLQYWRVGRWRDYLYGERAYILLRLIARSLLAWQVFVGSSVRRTRLRSMTTEAPNKVALVPWDEWFHPRVCAPFGADWHERRTTVLTPRPRSIIWSHEMQDQPEFQGSFSEGSGGEPRDHEGHLLRGSFGDGNCPECVVLVAGHAQHAKGSFSEGSGGLTRDEDGDLMKGSFADSACPICKVEAAGAGS